jgi:hypothetical protein
MTVMVTTAAAATADMAPHDRENDNRAYGQAAF